MQNGTARAGVLFALAAYTMWGVAPIYFKLIAEVPAAEILVHRIVWSAVVLVLLAAIARHYKKVSIALRQPRVLLILALSGLLLAGNWLLFIWAVNNDHILDASLGYYINPLLNVLLGYLFLSERFRPMQLVAMALAVTGVVILVISHGQLPWISLVLACSFGVYGLLRKTVSVDSLPGLLIETSMMVPFALIYWWGFATSEQGLLHYSTDVNLLLLSAGIITTAPLLCFTAAARRIRYSTLGFFQYIGPSIMFLIAVFVYGEPLEPARLTTFGFVWVALALFSLDSLRSYRQAKAVAVSQDA